jgi:hypothetical protein
MHILTFIDHFTKFVKLYPVPNQSAKTTADKFLDFSCTFGFPEYLLSDKGGCFMSDVFRILCTRLGVTKINTTPLNPRANGQSEKINSNIKKSLSIFAHETQQWDDFVNFYELLYNSSLHSTTNEKPAYLHLSYDPTLPTDVINNEQRLSKPASDDYVANKTFQLQYTFEKVRDRLIKAAEAQEEYQHKSAKYRDFSCGQLVYMYSPDTDRNSHLPKRRNYVGPMRILQVHNRVLCTVIDASNPKAKPVKVHTQRLIPYIERKRELDFLYKLVQEQKSTQDLNNGANALDKPHATFDELTDDDLITYALHTANNTGENGFVQTHQRNASHSHTTEIYDSGEDIVPTPSPIEDTSLQPPIPTHNYYLRSGSGAQTPSEAVNGANRLFNWTLSLTEPNNSTPAPVKFLQKLSEALN